MTTLAGEVLSLPVGRVGALRLGAGAFAEHLTLAGLLALADPAGDA